MSGINPEVLQDWQLNKSLLDCSSQLYLSTHLSDITFVFPEETPRVVVPAHKFILALRSPVFETMFYGFLPAKDEVEIVDQTSNSFKTFLKFLYTDRSEFTTCSEAIVTMQAAHFYRIPLLADICATFLESTIDSNTVCAVLDQARLYEFERLKSQCLKLIDEQAAKVFQTDGFMAVSQPTIALILESNNLCLDEYEIYQAAVDWAGAECFRKGLEVTGENKRKALDGAFYHIRIPHISLKIFSSLISREGLLTNEEVIALFRYHTLDSQETLPFVRCDKRNLSSMMVSRMQDGVRRTSMSKGWRAETIKFRVSQKSRLVSLGLLNVLIRSHTDDEYFADNHLLAMELEDLKVTCSVSDSDDDFIGSNGLDVTSHHFAFKSEERKYITVDLPNPINLVANNWYKLDVTMYSYNKSELKCKNFIQLLGSAIKSTVTLPSGLKVKFLGSTHGPIHSIFLR